jgi:solute carrier family 50 protein (sugar transporter)
MSDSPVNNPPIVNVLGVLGNSFAIIFFLIPTLMIRDMIKTKNTSTIPWLLFIFTILNCEFWMIYGFKIKAWAVYLCNAIGIFSNHIFLILFFLYVENTKLLNKLIYILTLLVSFTTIFVIFHFAIQNKNIVGGIACAMNIFMFAAPLQKIKEVYEKKDNTYIPIYISICLVLNCLIWISFGCFKNMDYFIIIPNTLGLCLSLFQVYLWFKFKEDTDRRLLEEENQVKHVKLEDGDHSDEELKSVKDNQASSQAVTINTTKQN